jgi:hypothetical protein
MTNIKDHLSYNPKTGTFIWINPLSPRVRKGSAASYVDKDGYKGLRYKGKYYRGHRLAYWWMTGEWPKAIDHVNGNKQDNSFTNLRPATARQNLQNQRKPRSDNTSGFLGVCYHAGKYEAFIGDCDKTYYLGRYPTGEEAHQAYLVAKRKLHEYDTL